MSSAVAAFGLFVAGAILGGAITTRGALADGFERAQHAAGSADVVARFDPVERGAVEQRVASLANVARSSERLSVRPVELGVLLAPHHARSGTAEVDGLVDRRADGFFVVAGHGLTGAAGEVLVDRGLADAWHLRVGMPLRLRSRRDYWYGRIAGIVVEPDDVAYPLASRPRVYLPYAIVRSQIADVPGRQPVNELLLHVRDRSLLPVTLSQAREASFGLTGLALTTRSGTRAVVDRASGLVTALLGAFALVTLAAAIAMLSAAGNARVARDLPTLGALRAIGFGWGSLAASYALEAAVVAASAGGLGIIAGALAVSGPTGDLLRALNESPPPHLLGAGHLLALAAAVTGAVVAAALPAFSVARRPVVSALRGASIAGARRGPVVGRPVLLGARLALARPGRLAVAGLAVAASVAIVLLMLTMARFLVAAEKDPALLGERYTLLVPDGPGVFDRVLSTSGVAAAATRYEVAAVDGFDLGEPMQLIAFGAGQAAVFPGRPLSSGRRAHGHGETEIGEGLAQSLGLALGGTLVADLQGGGEVRLRVVGIVQELANDGRIAYTDAAALLRAQPSLKAQVAVRVSPGVSPAAVAARFKPQGLSSRTNGGLAPAGSPFVSTIVSLLRAVAVLNGLGCLALVLLALVVLARERAATIGVLRAVGGSMRHTVALLSGAGVMLITVALPVGWVLERWVFAPLVSRVVDRYGALPLVPSLSDLSLIAGGGVAAVVMAATIAGRRYASVTVLDALRTE
jgi:ABC-type antimicrobial peptide transport system permease subunit